MNIEYYLLLSENPIYLAGGWGWRRVYIKNLKEWAGPPWEGPPGE